MSKPGPLPFGVLPRGDENFLVHPMARLRAAHQAAHRIVAGRVPCRRIWRYRLHQPSHLVWPAVVEHVVDPPSDAFSKRRPRIHHKIARPPTGLPWLLAMQITHTPPREQSDLDGANELGSSEVGTRRIQHANPTSQLVDAHDVEGGVECGPARRVEHGLVKQSVEQRTEIESRSAHDERKTRRTNRLVYPTIGVVRPRGRRVAGGRIHDVDAFVRHARALIDVGLAVPMSNPRYTCRESALMIVTGMASAIHSATALFPAAVGPQTTPISATSETSLNLVPGQLHDRRPPVHVVGRQRRIAKRDIQRAHLTGR